MVYTYWNSPSLEMAQGIGSPHAHGKEKAKPTKLCSPFFVAVLFFFKKKPYGITRQAAEFKHPRHTETFQSQVILEDTERGGLGGARIQTGEYTGTTSWRNTRNSGLTLWALLNVLLMCLSSVYSHLKHNWTTKVHEALGITPNHFIFPRLNVLRLAETQNKNEWASRK